MTTSVSFDRSMIAPCGINCGTFLELEVKKWTCPNCGSTLSVHRDNCLQCSYDSKNNVL